MYLGSSSGVGGDYCIVLYYIVLSASLCMCVYGGFSHLARRKWGGVRWRSSLFSRGLSVSSVAKNHFIASVEQRTGRILLVSNM